MALLEFLAQVDELHGRERTILDARGDLEQAILPRTRVLKSFKRRSCRAKKRDSTFEPREHRRTRSHNDTRFASANAPPFARTFIFRQAAVQYRDDAAKSRANQ